MSPMAATQLGSSGKPLSAGWHRGGAASMEAATVRRCDQTGDLATSCDGGYILPLHLYAFRIGGGCDEELGIGMFGLLNNLFARTTLHHLSRVHHQRIFSKVASTGNIVCDKQECQMLLVFQS